MFSAINLRIKRTVLRMQKAQPVVRISDTTLRDGLQTPGIRLDPEQRVRIAQALASAGVHSIDCGFPAAGPSELAAVKRIAQAVKGPILSAHARTKKEDIDAAAEALASVSPLRKAVTLFIGVSPVHRQYKHEMSKAQVIDAVVKSIEHAQKSFEMISFGPEDASRTEPEFLHEVYQNAIRAGVVTIGFTDTVGILTPGKTADAIKRIRDEVRGSEDAMLAVHFHNDLGLATANSLAAVAEGANIVQGTINGIGERAGNTPIEEVVLALTLHKDEFKRSVSVNPAALFELCDLVARLTGFRPAPNKAVVGRNLFRTETGVHQDGLLKNPMTYLPFPPELIGAGPVELVLGRNSGRNAVRHHLAASGIEPTEEHVELVLQYLKDGDHTTTEKLEVRGFMQRLKPFLSEDEFLAQKVAQYEADILAANADSVARSPETVA